MATSDPIPPSNFGKLASAADPIANGVEDSEALSSLLMLAKSNARLEPTALDTKDDDKFSSSELAQSEGNESGLSSNTHETVSANDEGILNNDGSISDSPSADKPVKDIDSSEDVKTDEERHSPDQVHDERSSPTLIDGTLSGDQKTGILVNSNSISTTDQFSSKKNAPIVQPRSSSAGAPRHRQAERSQALDSAASAARAITIDELRKYFHLPIADVAKQLGTCTTALKKICRKLNIVKWPYRQILSLTKSIQSLEIAAKSEHLDEKVRRQYQDQISLLHRVIAEVLRNPNKTIEHCNLSDLANEVAKGILPDSFDANELDDGSGNEQEESPNGERPRRSSGGGDEKAAASADLPPAPNGAHHSRSRAVSMTPMDEEVESILRRAAETAAIPRVKAPSRSQSHTLQHSSSLVAPSSSTDAVAHSSSMKPPPPVSRHSSDEMTRGKRKLGDLEEAAGAEAAAAEAPADASANGARSATNNAVAASSGTAATATATANAASSSSGQRFPNIDIGTTVVNVHYYDDRPENWTFYGPVRLPPLQRKKFRPPATGNATRRNVPLMEPDVGSNAAVEFVPQTLVTAFKKSIAEQSAAAVLSTNLMMYNPLTGAYTSHLDPTVALSPMTLAMAQNPIAMHGGIAPPAPVHRSVSGSAPHVPHGHLAHYNVPVPQHRMGHGHPAAASSQQFSANLPLNAHHHHHHQHHLLHSSSSPPPPPGVLAPTRQSSATMGDGNDLNDPSGGYAYHTQSTAMHPNVPRMGDSPNLMGMAPHVHQQRHASRPPSQQMTSHPSQSQSHPPTQQAMSHYASYMTALYPSNDSTGGKSNDLIETDDLGDDEDDTHVANYDLSALLSPDRGDSHTGHGRHRTDTSRHFYSDGAHDEHQYLDPLQMDMVMSSSDQLDSGVEPERKKARILTFSPTPSTTAENDEDVGHRDQANPSLRLRRGSHSGEDDNDDDGDSAIWAAADFDPQRG